MSATNLTGNYQRGCVSGLFENDSKAERALDELQKAGFSREHIAIATAGEGDRKSGFWDKIGAMLGKEDHPEPSETLKDSLLQCGVDQETAEYFDDSLERGNVLITVQDDSTRIVRAREILQTAGADLGMAKAGTGTIHREGARREARVPAERGIQLRGEVLRATKERVAAGEVRLRKEVVTEKQHLEVPVEKENLVIERRPGVGQEAAGPIGNENQEIRVPLSEERVRMEKKPVVNEEVRVRKEPVEETKRVEAEVRHEELRSDKQGRANVREDKKKDAA